MKPIINGLYQPGSTDTSTTTKGQVSINLDKLENIRHWKSMTLLNNVYNDFKLIDASESVTVHSTATNDWYAGNKNFEAAGTDLKTNPFSSGMKLTRVAKPDSIYKWLYTDNGEATGYKYFVFCTKNSGRPSLYWKGPGKTKVGISLAVGNSEYYQDFPPTMTAVNYGMLNKSSGGGTRQCSLTATDKTACNFDISVYFQPQTSTPIFDSPITDLAGDADKNLIDVELVSLKANATTQLTVTVKPLNNTLDAESWTENLGGLSIIIFIKKNNMYYPYEVSGIADDIKWGDDTHSTASVIKVTSVNAPALLADGAYPDLTKIPAGSFACLVDMTTLRIMKPTGGISDATNKVVLNGSGMTLDQCFYNKIMSTRFSTGTSKNYSSMYYMLDSGKVATSNTISLLNTFMYIKYVGSNNNGRSPLAWLNSTAYHQNNPKPTKPFCFTKEDPDCINQSICGGSSNAMLGTHASGFYLNAINKDSDSTPNKDLFTVSNLAPNAFLKFGGKQICAMVPLGYTNVVDFTSS